MTAPHETDRFRNAATYIVAVKVTVAGGARERTAVRRAERVAERIVNAAARLAHVDAASARYGIPDPDDRQRFFHSSWLVHFSAANSGSADHDGKLSRYLDPEHDRAIASRRQTEQRRRQQEQDDRSRRSEVGCLNAYREGTSRRDCRCAYCVPHQHLTRWRRPNPADRPLCLCGPVHVGRGGRCERHRDAELVILDDDPPELQLLADYVPGPQPDDR